MIGWSMKKKGKKEKKNFNKKIENTWSSSYPQLFGPPIIPGRFLAFAPIKYIWG